MSNSYAWEIHLQFGHEVSYETARGFTKRLNSAVLAAIERTVSDESAGQSAVKVISGVGSDDERVISIRKTFQIKKSPQKISSASYATAEEAIEAMRACRDQAAGQDKASYVVTKESDGSFYVARETWASCEFDTQVEAEDALQAFEDPAPYKMIPVVVLESISSSSE